MSNSTIANLPANCPRVILLKEKMSDQQPGSNRDIEQVHLWLDPIERTLRARPDRIETEMNRLRSVVYLLVKDKPEMLRLLGQSPPPSGDKGRI